MSTLRDVSVLLLWGCLYVDSLCCVCPTVVGMSLCRLSVMCLSYCCGDVFMSTLCDVSVLLLWGCLYVNSL